ncbi:TerC family protein, partial [Slackia exigua]
ARLISLPQAVGTIVVMDLVFSIDSVITAVGLANHLIIMVIAVLFAIVLMIVFIDFISDFINSHPEMKILALTFITVIGILLVLDGLGINSGFEVFDMHAEKLMVYFAMVFAFVLELIQMSYNRRVADFRVERPKEDDAS